MLPAFLLSHCRDLEDGTLLKMRQAAERQAAERQRLIEELQSEEGS